MSQILSVPLWIYKKDGEEKTNFETIGRIITKDNGKVSVKLSPMVTNFLKQLFWESFEGWVNIFEDKKKEEQQSQQDTDWDLPF